VTIIYTTQPAMQYNNATKMFNFCLDIYMNECDRISRWLGAKNHVQSRFVNKLTRPLG